MRFWALALALLVGCGEPRATFRRDVLPILEKHCVQCHRERGDAPFALDTFARAEPRTEAIARVTRERRMPPWPVDANTACPPLRGQRGLTVEEIATLGVWMEDGAEEGAGPLPTSAPVPEGALDRVDLVVQVEKPYLPPRLVDDYRCFILDTGLTEDRFVTGFAVRPEVPGIAHHLMVFAVDDAESETELRAKDDGADDSGFDCQSFPELPLRYLTVWSPGDPARRHPPGSGLPLRVGRPLLIQVHYHDHGVGLADRMALELELASSVELEAQVWSVPAGIYGLAPGQPRIEISGRHPPLDGTYRIWGVRPHMHGLGVGVRIGVQQEGQESCVLALDRWDDGTQPMYFLDAPVVAGPGSEITVTCAYDTRSRSTPTFWGWRLEDEMCLAHLYVTR